MGSNTDKQRLIFATNDNACWLIGSLFKLRGGITLKGETLLSFGDISYNQRTFTS